MIEIRSVRKEYITKNTRVVGVDNVSLTIQTGEVYGIVGYSGAGKSSLIRCLNLLERPTKGNIIIDGIDLTSLSGKELRKQRQKIGMIFQHFSLVSSKTVFENVAFALKAAHQSKGVIKSRVLELLDIVGLSDKKDVYPAQLSGGQKQRVGIARALANDPTVLLCDEATSALDPTTTKAILQLLKKISRELGITIVLITHEMEVVKELCHRVAVMQDGRIIEEGSVYEIFSQPKQQLTKQFISSVLDFELPSHLIEESKGTIIQIQFEGPTAGESILSDALQKYSVKGNILHGKIEYIQDVPLGILIIELIGEAAEVQSALEYITNRTSSVEVLKHVTV
ncbi:methionine ABC transporter ATP-binding protein [Peribacillus butanolivorans]|uniref:Methionine ABC transporter ATP-binding protein n=1 Tax=Peribacillus butanolivorans TaxID=421767 RepID=A0AAX0RYT0_9BACI|nr:methionine ABC transporter ATP-binding protein [Peribacillus butanolivorans]AXN40070.1 methionine ABC transporter ATP-binding protein [Peribacillus butanolivorans]PEJ27925.1 methionine ABC transporter ATP-binding protein [Peribacillus butanolivorans]